MGTNSTDEIDFESFIDQINDSIDFPPDNECESDRIVDDSVNSGDCNDLPIALNVALPNSDDIFSNNSASDFSAEISLPYDEIAELEWLSTFVEDSFSEPKKEEIASLFPNKKGGDEFRTSSPISVLETGNGSGSGTNASSTVPRCGPQRARSKRTRLPAFNPRLATVPLSGSSSSDPRAEGIVPEVSGPEQKNKKRRTKKTTVKEESDQATNVRKCVQCEVTETPQWRAGPAGPRTLCNACGVRFKSGRLLPEYRPAASPTFVPAVHSNLHRKVLEMRSKAGQGGAVGSAPNV